MEITQDFITIIAVAAPMVVIAALALRKRSNKIPTKITVSKPASRVVEPVDDHLPIDSLLESYDEMDPPLIYEDELDLEGELVVEEAPKKEKKEKKVEKPAAKVEKKEEKKAEKVEKKNSKEKLKVISKDKSKPNKKVK